MTAYDVLYRIGMCQKSLQKLTIEMMTADSSDGVRWAKSLDKHAAVYRDMITDARQHGDIDNEQSEALEELL